MSIRQNASDNIYRRHVFIFAFCAGYEYKVVMSDQVRDKNLQKTKGQ